MNSTILKHAFKFLTEHKDMKKMFADLEKTGKQAQAALDHYERLRKKWGGQ